MCMMLGYDTQSFIVESVLHSVNSREPNTIDVYAGYYGMVIGGGILGIIFALKPGYELESESSLNKTKVSAETLKNYRQFSDSEIRFMYGSFAGIALLSNLIFFMLPRREVNNSLSKESEMEWIGFFQQMKLQFSTLLDTRMILLSLLFAHWGFYTSFWTGVYPTTLVFTKSLTSNIYLPAFYAIFIGLGEIFSRKCLLSWISEKIHANRQDVSRKPEQGAWRHVNYQQNVGCCVSHLTKQIKFFGMKPTMILGFILSCILFLIILATTPRYSTLTPNNDPALLIDPSTSSVLLIAFLLGAADGCLSTCRNVICSIVIPNRRAQVFSISKFYQSLAACAAFFLSPLLTVYSHLLIMTIFLTCATIAFFHVTNSIHKLEKTHAMETELTPIVAFLILYSSKLGFIRKLDSLKSLRQCTRFFNSKSFICPLSPKWTTSLTGSRFVMESLTVYVLQPLALVILGVLLSGCSGKNSKGSKSPSNQANSTDIAKGPGKNASSLATVTTDSTVQVPQSTSKKFENAASTQRTEEDKDQKREKSSKELSRKKMAKSQKEGDKKLNNQRESAIENNTRENKCGEEIRPKQIKLNEKEERIAQGKEVRNKGDYPTFNDVESDWDSAKDNKASYFWVNKIPLTLFCKFFQREKKDEEKEKSKKEKTNAAEESPEKVTRRLERNDKEEKKDKSKEDRKDVIKDDKREEDDEKDKEGSKEKGGGGNNKKDESKMLESEASIANEHLSASVSMRRRSHSISDDYSVQRTNDDATQCKFTAVQLNYWEDEFLKRFAYGSGVAANARRDPEISIGYWARVAGLNYYVDQFIERTEGHCQIVVLAREMQHSDLHCGDYHLVGADLRQWAELKGKFDSTGLDFCIPTLFLADIYFCLKCYFHELTAYFF
uniref:Acyl_transf_3 domain-containing protein n=1 Tax=Heterorhabditis bacteriophora TaxID=37862 RepID=A0A1I7XG67_HETBA